MGGHFVFNASSRQYTAQLPSALQLVPGKSGPSRLLRLCLLPYFYALVVVVQTISLLLVFLKLLLTLIVVVELSRTVRHSRS